ncbi:MAG: hypothetical protein AAGG07_01090 [Planctomycetota bacterium]
MKPASMMSQAEINRFCRAASAAYYAIVHEHTRRTGECALLPELICPDGPAPCLCEFSTQEIEEAEDFLFRMGMIGMGPYRPGEGLGGGPNAGSDLL